MGELADRLGALRVRAALPDGSFAAELAGRGDVTLVLAPGEYGRHAEPEVGRRLAQLARLLWARRTAEYFRVRSEVTGQVTTREAPPVGRRDHEYADARDALRAHGASADGRVRIDVRGMREWTVRISPGTIRALTEAEFVAAVAEAAANLVTDQQDQIRDLAVRVYG